VFPVSLKPVEHALPPTLTSGQSNCGNLLGQMLRHYEDNIPEFANLHRSDLCGFVPPKVIVANDKSRYWFRG